MRWWGRQLADEDRVISHCDLGRWKVLVRDGLPVAFVDWDTAGPARRRWALAEAAWLIAQLHDDNVAELQSLPDVRTR